jgi:hypothetical protein
MTLIYIKILSYITLSKMACCNILNNGHQFFSTGETWNNLEWIREVSIP